MIVGFGRTCAKGSLPVYAVADEKEAQDLIVLSCETNIRGEYLARELVQEQTLENLDAFSERLDRMHDILKRNGHCRCENANTNPERSATP